MALVRVLVVAAALSAASLAAAQTKPADNRSFVTVALSTANFIDEAGRIALATESGQGVQRFARSAVFDQSDARDRIGPWTNATQPVVSGRSAVVSSELPAPLASLSAELTAITATGKPSDSSLSRTDGGVVVTGAQRALLDKLQTLTGREFDHAYIESQRSAYTTLETAYRSYAEVGDDPALRKAAKRELPVLRRQLKQLDAL